VLIWFIFFPIYKTEHVDLLQGLNLRQLQTERTLNQLTQASNEQLKLIQKINAKQTQSDQFINQLNKTSASYKTKLDELSSLINVIHKNYFLIQKLDELDKMRKQKLISVEDYNKKKFEILKRF
jgi:hypothetical protein